MALSADNVAAIDLSGLSGVPSRNGDGVFLGLLFCEGGRWACDRGRPMAKMDVAQACWQWRQIGMGFGAGDLMSTGGISLVGTQSSGLMAGGSGGQSSNLGIMMEMVSASAGGEGYEGRRAHTCTR
ncbi:hypothetical protein BDR06DRAFT_967917 [Suillus hirtellus]|nr:hypothetical protein BDR06DRAFT_967917 [Suillus hirtellus]